MKIAEIHDDVVVSGAQNVQVFTIEASAKAFSVLSQNLYSNTRGAMIRELSTNAYDAHVMSGVADKPFVLTLPNSLEPTFKIRDFGPGLSEEQVNSVLTTFFKSTKTDSNDVVGCMGLGSKTPFGVSDSFTVTSYHGGLKTIYSAFLSSKRIPSVAKFASFESDEPTGLEIEVAVKSTDFSLYQREVNDQLRYFKVKPVILGCSSFKWDEPENILFSGSNWKWVHKNTGAIVVQGQIQYPINVHDMGAAYYDATPGVKEVLTRNSVIFDVQIGDVNVAPSREALYYDDATCETLIKSAKKLIEELPALIENALINCETLYDARVKFEDIASALSYGYHGELLKVLVRDGDGILWNGKNVTNSFVDLPEEDITSAFSMSKAWRGSKFTKTAFHPRVEYDANGQKKCNGNVWSLRATPLEKTVWIHNQENILSVTSRLRSFAASAKNRTYNVVTTPLTHEKFAEALGLRVDQVMSSVDLPKIKRKRGVKKTQPDEHISLLKYKHHIYDIASSLWGEFTIEKNDDSLTGFWVAMDRNNVMDGESVSTKINLLVQGLIDLDIIEKDDNIYGFRQSKKKPKHNLVNLFEYVREFAKLNPDTLKTICWDVAPRIKRTLESADNAETILDLLNPESPMCEVLQVIIKYRNSQQHSYSYTPYVKKYFNTPSLVEHIGDIETRYPMLRFADGYYTPASSLGVIAEYINLIDSITPTEASLVDIK